jgi:hypothetical protein
MAWDTTPTSVEEGGTPRDPSETDAPLRGRPLVVIVAAFMVLVALGAMTASPDVADAVGHVIPHVLGEGGCGGG